MAQHFGTTNQKYIRMIDILIMDDSDIKVGELRQVAAAILSKGEIHIDVATNINEGRSLMHEKQYDLLILDMVMPYHEDEESSHTAGAEYLEEIYQNESIKVPLQIIGLTEFEQEFTQQQQDFRDKLWHLLFYSHTDNKWHKDLRQKITQLHQFKKTLEVSMENRNKYDVAIICALNEEFEQLLKAFSRNNWEYLEHPALPYTFRTTTIHTAGLHDVRIIATCANKQGVCATSVLATALYTSYKVDTIFMTGITAGFPKEGVNSEDIIVAESINDYAIGKVVEDAEHQGEIRLLHEIQQIPANRSLISKVSAFLHDYDDYPVHISKTVCGPFVMSSETIMQSLLKDDRKYQALDMEGFALYLAAHTLERKALWIKAISDFGVGKDDSHHEAAALKSAKFLCEFIRAMF